MAGARIDGQHVLLEAFRLSPSMLCHIEGLGKNRVVAYLKPH